MKKIFVLTLAAAALLVSCNKEGKTRIEYEEPIYTSLAVKYEVEPTLLQDVANVDKLSNFEVTETGDFIIVDKNGTYTGQVTNLKEIADKPVDSSRKFECGTWGSVEVSPITKADADVKLTFYPKGGLPIVLSATSVTASSSLNPQFLMKLARKWAITYTTISVSGGDLGNKLSAGLNWNGCDLAQIKADLEEKAGKTFDMGDVSGYVVDYVEITRAGSLVVKFKNGKSVAADIDITTPSADKATFEYEVAGEQAGVSIFYGKANGEITFDKKGNCQLVMNTKIDHSNDSYKGKVVFKVKKID